MGDKQAELVSGERLYSAILARRSVRRYRIQPLPSTFLQETERIIVGSRPLSLNNRFEAHIQHAASPSEMVEKVGGYGRIINPPHFIVPFIRGNAFPLVDLGYQVQQIVIHLTAAGLGTCYIGQISRQDKVRAALQLPANAEIGAIVAFGWQADSAGGRTANTLLHTLAGAEKKLSAHEIFFDGSFGKPAQPPHALERIVEAARRAPSAVNAQPWRLLWNAGYLYLFVRRNNLRYAGNSDYRYYDGGICMANISLALQTMGIETGWELIGAGSSILPVHPRELEGLGRIRLDLPPDQR